jgi:tetratricopeptide (TPR) repeat protein
MSSKPFQRKDLKHDQFVIGAGRATHWLMERRRKIGWAVLGVAVVLSVIFSVRFAHQRQEHQAAALLGAALDIYRAPVVLPAPEPAATPVSDPGGMPGIAGESGGAEGAGGGAATGGEATAGTEAGGAATDPGQAATAVTADQSEGSMDPEPAMPELAPVTTPTGLQFGSLADKNNAAIERLEPIVERYGSRPSGRLAAYYLGICQSELGNTDAAIAALGQAVEASAPLISDMALFRLGQLELGVGNADAAVGHFDRLLEGGNRLFPLEEALMAKARAHQDGGDPRAALAAYQRVLNEYSGTYAAVEARARAEELSAELGVELQEPGGISS